MSGPSTQEPVESLKMPFESGIVPLPITWTHARRVYGIAATHPDPFDRLLLAQAICEPLHLLTSDGALAQYSRDLVITV
jgi:PIN domain nuclease of toxin-antitoxin system